MNRRSTIFTLLCGLMAVVGLPMTVQAALIDRGLFDADGIPGGPTVRLIYDDDRNIPWLGMPTLAQVLRLGGTSQKCHGDEFPKGHGSPLMFHSSRAFFVHTKAKTCHC